MRLACTLIFLLVAAGAAAQSAEVSIDGPGDGSVGVDAPSTFTFNVTNGQEASGSPLDDQNRARVTMHLEGLPDGWNAAASPTDFRLGPGQMQEVEVRVTVIPGAASEGTLTVTALLTTPLEGLDPVTGEVPGGSQTSSASAELALERTQSVTRNVLETIGPWIFVLFAALVAAVVIAAKLVADNRRVTVSVSSPDRKKAVPAGGRVALSLTVRNLARGEDTLVFQVRPVGDGWAAFLPVAELELPRGGSEKLHLVVIAPDDAKPGDRQEVLVTAHSALGPRHPASITFEAYVE